MRGSGAKRSGWDLRGSGLADEAPDAQPQSDHALERAGERESLKASATSRPLRQTEKHNAILNIMSYKVSK